MAEEYVIIVKFKAKLGKEKLLETFLTSIINIAMQSPGCIDHSLHRHLTDPSVFMFYERWQSEKAHERHIARPEVKEWRIKLESFLDKPYEASLWVRLEE